jgi:phosphomannomutase
MTSSVFQRAEEYVQWDPNPETRNVVEKLLESKNEAELSKLLNKRVQFGTAGLRAAMGAGYACMNDLVVLQTCQGLIRYLESMDSSCKSKGIVVGYDHRQSASLSSLGFAQMTAAVFLSQGFKVYFLENFVATPFVPFAIAHYHCAAGIMVTASHNPKADNGYKVYWGNGAQIIPPHDGGIANQIDLNLQPWQTYHCSSIHNDKNFVPATSEVVSAYINSIASMSLRKEANASSPLRVAYTAMHGVGYQWIVRAFEAFHHPSLFIVPSQQHPDPSFPTVVFPNPEEKGALDEAMRFATANNCSLIIANDPDADRLAVAQLLLVSSDGIPEWKAFSGNEIGVLLGYWQIMNWKSSHSSSSLSSPCPPAAVLASVVSSRMLKTIARVEGMVYHDTLTGFKWLGNRAIELRESGMPVIFSYEEALGFCLGNSSCDKDGISAASLFVEMASALQNGWVEGKGEGAGPARSVVELLDSLNQKYGEFISYNSYVISKDPKVTDEIFHNLRHGGENGGYWKSAVGQSIVSLQDITMGYDSSTADHKSSLPQTPDSHMIMYEFANGVSVTLRTSGTEPKIKYYTEIAGKPGQHRSELHATLHAFVDSLVEEMLQPTKYGLGRP